MKMINNSGPNTLPCGTPDVTWDSELTWPSTRTVREIISYPFENAPSNTIVLRFLEEVAVGYLVEGLFVVEQDKINLSFVVRSLGQVINCEDQLGLA